MIRRRLAGVLLAAVLAAVPLAAADKGPAGMWRVQFVTPLGQSVVNMTINQSGTKLTGHVTDEFGEYPVEGRFVDGYVTVTWSVPDAGKLLQITMKGKLDGDAIDGTATLGDVGEGSLTARRVGDAG
jgi:hypothetical protein